MPCHAMNMTTHILSSFIPANGWPRWVVMWALVVWIYAGFKWVMWKRAASADAPATTWRSIIFLTLWPGMDAGRFLDKGCRAKAPKAGEWISAAVNTALGAALLWGVARHSGDGLAAGWLGMIGMIYLLHFGVFKFLANFWRCNSICAQPLMRNPVAARSVGDFWSKRWNLAFRDLSFGLIFGGFRRRYGVRTATMLTFIVSGLIHDLIISVPAGGGYGLPTAYFTLQGAGMLFDHSRFAARTGLRQDLPGRVFAWLIVAGPAFALFPPPFVLRVIVPFMRAIGALPGGGL